MGQWRQSACKEQCGDQELPHWRRAQRSGICGAGMQHWRRMTSGCHNGVLSWQVIDLAHTKPTDHSPTSPCSTPGPRIPPCDREVLCDRDIPCDRESLCGPKIPCD
eukprot:362201-Chlamydomonas_euryale.AAC.10